MRTEYVDLVDYLAIAVEVTGLTSETIARMVAGTPCFAARRRRRVTPSDRIDARYRD